ncbi:energy coupling factor transporter S component ThiW [Dehalobacterium formicoaceticum]|uniref:Energy coupling factor transporter S component ThiW n=1 Tax=Dehalobacterium formicoaceticum TaxID=51515 RepID=A0ABT1Y580_9FIRM|nr:energy coupling factor transporter S component ThiW [Dehalobacterium formicoaceticum]MCR6546029.1 energy coupling factor transporter S component ThiW [Dehalobacterium formicoaceticum]
MNKVNIQKLSIAGILCAVAVVGSLLAVPVLGSKCAPVQHMVNILCAVLLGPGYGLGVAFSASLIRNLLGLGSLMAFPGSMFGALLCGLMYRKTKKLFPTLAAEVFGTAILGGLSAYPLAVLFLGQAVAGLVFYAYIIPFLISTAAGAFLSGVLVYSLQKSGVLADIQFRLNASYLQQERQLNYDEGNA